MGVFNRKEEFKKVFEMVKKFGGRLKVIIVRWEV